MHCSMARQISGAKGLDAAWSLHPEAHCCAAVPLCALSCYCARVQDPRCTRRSTTTRMEAMAVKQNRSVTKGAEVVRQQ